MEIGEHLIPLVSLWSFGEGSRLSVECKLKPITWSLGTSHQDRQSNLCECCFFFIKLHVNCGCGEFLWFQFLSKNVLNLFSELTPVWKQEQWRSTERNEPIFQMFPLKRLEWNCGAWLSLPGPSPSGGCTWCDNLTLQIQFRENLTVCADSDSFNLRSSVITHAIFLWVGHFPAQLRHCSPLCCVPSCCALVDLWAGIFGHLDSVYVRRSGICPDLMVQTSKA